MRIALALVFLATISVWVWRAPLSLAQQDPLVVQGRVVNRTTGGGGVSGLTLVFEDSPAFQHRLETTADETGRFRFSDVAYNPAAVYILSVTYQGAMYRLGVDLSNGSQTGVELTIYDAVDDDQVLSASSASVLFSGVDKSTGMVSVLEIVRILNDSDRTYVPGPQPMKLVRFGLPGGATGLTVDTSIAPADFVQVDRGFALLSSVPPGEHEIMYAYEFPYQGREGTWTRSFNYGSAGLRVLAPRGLIELSSPQLDGPEEIIVGERPYLLLQASGIERGTQVDLKLSGLPQPSVLDRVSRSLDSVRLEYTAVVGLAMLMIALLAYGVLRRRGGRPVEHAIDDP